MNSPASACGIPERLGEPKCRLAVEDAKVHRLGDAPHRRCDVGRRHAADGRRGPRVDILAGGESGPHRRIAGEMREDPELDLRVVGGYESPARLARQERRADLLPFGCPRGDVLQIRVAGTEPARRGHRLIERRVHAAGPRIDERRQRVDVGALELRVFAMFEKFRGQRMERRQLLQHLGIGARPRLAPLHHGQAQFVEQHGPELDRRGDREVAARQRVNLAFERGEPPRVVGGERGELRGVDPHPPALHAGQHHRQRHLDRREQIVEAIRRQRGGEGRSQAVDEPAMRRGIRDVGRAINGRGGRGVNPRHAMADGGLREAEIPLAGFEEIGGQQRVERRPCEAYPERPQGDVLPLDVVAAFGNGWIGKQKTHLGVRRQRLGGGTRRLARQTQRPPRRVGRGSSR